MIVISRQSEVIQASPNIAPKACQSQPAMVIMARP
jgi:hypothetical protein